MAVEHKFEGPIHLKKRLMTCLARKITLPQGSDIGQYSASYLTIYYNIMELGSNVKYVHVYDYAMLNLSLGEITVCGTDPADGREKR